MADEDDKHQVERALQPDPEDAAEAEAEPAAGAGPRAEAGPLLTPERLQQLKLGVLALWLVAVIVAGQVGGIQLAFLALAGGVLVLVITLMWISVQSLTGGASLGFEEALGMGAPSKAEEQKRAVLRALKDLEYERGVGKISPEDYAELSAKYRAEAKRLMQSLDETLAPARQEVERVLQSRLSRAGIEEPLPGADEPAPEPEQPAPEPEQPAEPELTK